MDPMEALSCSPPSHARTLTSYNMLAPCSLLRARKHDRKCFSTRATALSRTRVTFPMALSGSADAGVKRSLDDAEAIIGGKRQALGEVDLGMSSSLKILIANKSAGSIIGKAGATINAIKENSGARVKVSSSTEVFPGTNDRIVLIQGTALSIITAARLVVQELFRDPTNAAAKAATEAGVEGMAGDVQLTCTIAIPGQACGLIIGKGGERINQLRDTTQAKIQMQSKDKAVPGLNERTVSVQGNLMQVTMGVNEIARVLLEDGSVQYENQSTNYGMTAGAMMGGGGGGFAGAGLAGLGGGGGDMMGGGAGQITMKLAIAESSVGILVGKAGCVIKELMQISGASIKVSQKGEVVPGTTNRYVTISGNPVAANYAQMLVLQKVPDATSV